MTRRAWGLAALAGVVLAAGTACAAPADATSPPAPSGTTLHLYERDTAPAASIDLGTPGAGPGDLFVFTGDLFDGGPTGPKVGRADGACTTTSGDPSTPGSLVCLITTSLPDGQLETQGVVDGGAFYGGAPAPLAITGGTGAYRDARGDGTVTVPDVADPSAVRFDLSTSP